MLAENRVVSSLNLDGLSSECDVRDMHPMIQHNSTLSHLYVDSGIPKSPLWKNCKSLHKGDAQLKKNQSFQMARFISAKHAFIISRFLIIFDIPFEIQKEILWLLLMEWFLIDARLLQRVLLDRSRIGSLTQTKSKFSASSLISACYLNSVRVIS